MSRADAGFTVIEALVIVLGVSILAAIAVPSLRAAEDGWALETAAADVAARLSEARTNALKRNRPTWVLLTNSTRTLQLQVLGGPGPGIVDVGAPAYLPPRVAFVFPTSTLQVSFDAMGRPINGAGIVTAQSVQVRHVRSLQVRQVTAETTGRITIN